MNAKECEARARKLIDKLNSHQLDGLDEYYAADSETVTEGTQERSLGPDGARKDTERWLNAFPDARFEVVSVGAGDDFVAVELIFRGTHEGALVLPKGTIPATGKRIEGHGCMFFRFANGKIVSEHDYFDGMEMMDQLGLLEGQAPARGTAEDRPVP